MPKERFKSFLYFIAASCVLMSEENRTEDDIDDANNNTEPLIQDIVFECEQSVYSNSSNNREGRNDLTVSALTWEPAMEGDDEESSDEE